MVRVACLLLLVASSWVQAAIGISSTNFPDGLQSPYSGNAASKGVITFDYNAQLLNNPDTVLAAKKVNRNAGSTLNTCSSAHCTASGTAAPIQDAGVFPVTGGYTATVDVGYQLSSTLAGNGSNQYKSINLNTEAQLAINGAGQDFYIDQLTMGYKSSLRLAPGDYWVRKLTTGDLSQIQVLGSGLVRLFISDDWSLASSALINSPAINAAGAPSNFYVFSYGSVTLNNQATLSGYVYSANAKGSNEAINLGSASYVFGALSGENIRLGTDSKVSYVAPASLVLSWQMNEGAWNGVAAEVQDRSGNGLNGRAYGGATTQISAPALPADSWGYGTCRYGSFSAGSRQYLQVADANLLDLSSFTVSVWVNPPSWPSSGLMSILSKDENFEFHLKPTGVVNWWWQDSNGAREVNSSNNSAGRAPLNTWTHVAIRFEPGRQTLFINGVANASASETRAPLNNSDPLQVGADQGYDGRYFNGSLDEVRVYKGVLSDAEVLALATERPASCPVAQVDHYELAYASNQALTCNPLAVTVRACANSTCSSLYGGSAAVTMSASAGNWSSNSLAFTGNVGVNYQLTMAGSATLGISSASPAAVNPLQCVVGGVSSSTCAVTFSDSGFIFDVPNMLSGKPTSASLQAVKKSDSSQKCVPGFAAGKRNVLFSRTYVSPGTGTEPVLVNGASVTNNTTVELNFDASALAPLAVRYDDAGALNLSASFTGSGLEAGLLMTGSDPFVARPVGYCVFSDSANSDCVSGDASCSKMMAAGDPFRLGIKAVAWETDGDTDFCTGNTKTRNYLQAGISLGSNLVAPAGGVAGTLAVASVDLVASDSGEKVLSNQTISEVGVFTLTATSPGTYLNGPPVGDSNGDGLLDQVSASVNIGRFYPASLDVSGSASLAPSCANADPLKSFSYQGQPMSFANAQEPLLTVAGLNRSGGLTSNYDRGNFWKLVPPGREAYRSVTGKSTLDAPGRLLTGGVASLTQSGADNGDGARSYRWTGEVLTYSPALLPLTDDLPFTAAIRQGFTAASLTDADGACYLQGHSSCQSFSFDFTSLAGSLVTPGSEVRLGRLRIDNANGSELQPLSLPLRLESWQGTVSGGFQLEERDACTSAILGGASPLLSNFTGNLAAGESTAVLLAPPSSPSAGAGVGGINLSAPGSGNDGSALVSLPALAGCGQLGVSQCLPVWLWYDWHGSGRELPQGLATFGIYKGSKPVIFRRELYR